MYRVAHLPSLRRKNPCKNETLVNRFRRLDVLRLGDGGLFPPVTANRLMEIAKTRPKVVFICESVAAIHQIDLPFDGSKLNFRLSKPDARAHEDRKWLIG